MFSVDFLNLEVIVLTNNVFSPQTLSHGTQLCKDLKIMCGVILKLIFSTSNRYILIVAEDWKVCVIHLCFLIKHIEEHNHALSEDTIEMYFLKENKSIDIFSLRH